MALDHTHAARRPSAKHRGCPSVVFDGEGRFVTAVLRPAKRPSGREVRAFLRHLLRQLRANWPRVEVLIRADSHYCAPEVLR